MSVETQVNSSLEEREGGGENSSDSPPPPLIVDGELSPSVAEDIEKRGRDEEKGEKTEEVGGAGGGGEPVEEFPLKQLTSLDEQLGRPKWVVPVRANDELETLIRSAIKLAKQRRDKDIEECQRFYREGLATSFIRILTDDAVKTWKPDIQLDIYNNSRYLIELCVCKIEDDSVHLLDLLAIVFNPSCKWNIFNANEEAMSCTITPKDKWEESLYARPPTDTNIQHVKGRLVDLINLFGELGGFDKLKKRICERDLTVNILSYLLKPFGLCSSFLSERVRRDYIIAIVDKSIEFLNSLNDDLLKKEATTDSRSETFSSIMKSLRHLCSVIPGRDDIETFRLKMILRLLQIPSFSGKMNALNEINKIVPTMSYHPHFRSIGDEDQLTSERIAEWIKNNNVLAIVFRDNLHQPQYVEKLDKLVRFCIKEKVLTLEDLDRIWGCQDGKHEAIVKNVHDLLVKLAWDFSPDQLDHLFGCFQRSWVGASKKQRDELLDFIRHLAEDDKEGIMASKVLELLWNLAHRDDCPLDTMEHALNAHIKILDYSCSQDRESQKVQWLTHCVDEVNEGTKWVIPALKQMREICLLYLESPVNYSSVHHPTSRFYYRNEIISHLDQNYHLLSQICSNLSQYILSAHEMKEKLPELDPELFCIDGRFNHYQQYQIRLDFIRFALKDGQLWLGLSQALMVWESMVVKPVFPSDKDACFKWFAKLTMWEEPDIEPDTARRLFTENILSLTPSTLTDSGFRCFDRFFRMVNHNQHKLSKWNRTCFITESIDLIGLDYLWDCVLQVNESIVHKPIELMKDIFTNLSSKLPQEQIHQEFITVCMQRMEIIHKVLYQYKPDEVVKEAFDQVNKLVRCLKLLLEYIVECDNEHMEERGIPPHGKSHWGKPLSLTIRYCSTQNSQPEDFEIWTHHHETIAALRRHIARKINVHDSSKLELSVGNEIIRKNENYRFVVGASVPLRDKMVVTVRLHQYSNISETSMQSSDNSTDSSDASIGQHDGPNFETERVLPSVLMADQDSYIDFLLYLCDFAVERQLVVLRDNVRNLLKLLPTGAKLLKEMLLFCKEKSQVKEPYEELESFVLCGSPSKTVYLLEITHSMLMTSVDTRDVESSEFQNNFIICGGLKLMFHILTSNDALKNADNTLRRSAYLSCLKVLKLLLVAQGYSFILSVSQEIKNNSEAMKGPRYKSALGIQEAMNTIISNVDTKLRTAATILAKSLCSNLMSPLPDNKVIESLQMLIWSSVVGDVSLMNQPIKIHEEFDKRCVSGPLDSEVLQLIREGLEALSLSMAVSTTILDTHYKTDHWRHFIIDIVLLAKNRLVRMSAQDQLFNMITKCCTDSIPVLISSIKLLFNALETIVCDHSSTSNEFFRLLSRLINHAHVNHVSVDGIQKLLDIELKWLEGIKDASLSSQTVSVEGPLLEGHLCLIVELLNFTSIEERYSLGSKPGGMELITNLVDHFLFPASRLVKKLKATPDLQYSEELASGICNSPDSVQACYKLLNALCMGVKENIETLSELLMDIFYNDDPPLVEWEYYPHIGPRPNRGYVGLKNAGATCYMNAVLQQLYMISPVRNGVLSLPEPALQLINENDEKEQEKKKLSEGSPGGGTGDRKETHCKVLMQLQSIFGHLLEGKVQFYIPKGFWKDFRLEGQQVNLREQHDAFEFFNTLVDSVDEGLKAFNAIPIVSKVLGGSFADQKICKGCPHRFSREEPFTAINVDIRLHHNLFESLDSYVKGDLLEGANAYRCEICNKEVDTVKRMCINKLPQVLVIQLKRFDYDWEREMAVKFNDYFEFPKEFDLLPYTAAGLAQIEGEKIPFTTTNDNKKGEGGDEGKKEDDVDDPSLTSKYRLRGILVHSGQASGGHYYSFINVKPPGSDQARWFKFDDGDVSEAKMEDEEEFKNQTFGGDYTGEVYDHVLKKSHQRRQKRWWSAYLLFYDRIRQDGADLTNDDDRSCTVPGPIMKLVQKQNLEYLHMKTHYSTSYYQFMKQLLILNYNFAKTQIDTTNPNEPMENFEKIGSLCVKLVTKFLFHSGFHTKKTLRGPANDWFDALNPYLYYSAKIRRWFCEEVFLKHRERFSAYLLECPSTELRNMFAKLIPHLCHISNKDDKFEIQLHVNTSVGIHVSEQLFSDIAFNQLLTLLKKEVSDHSRHLHQYFQAFLAYAHKGPYERHQLLRLGVPAQFIALSLDEGPGPPLRSPYADISRLYSVVGILVRSCDVSPVQRSSKEGGEVLPNPYADPELCEKLSNDLIHWLYERTSIQHSTTYVKKLIEDNSPIEETLRFLGFCSWENWEFSAVVIADLLMEIATVQPFDMRPYLDLLYHLLLMNDSWQHTRIRAMFLGLQDRVDGMMTMIQHGQTHVVQQKRAYLCIKFIVNLCSRCQMTLMVLDEDVHLKRLWQFAIQWLQNELERRQYSTSSYPYTGWSPPAQSNEVSNSYFLERSNSAKITLGRARELFPVEVDQFESTNIESTETSFDQSSSLLEKDVVSEPLHHEGEEERGGGHDTGEGLDDNGGGERGEGGQEQTDVTENKMIHTDLD